MAIPPSLKLRSGKQENQVNQSSSCREAQKVIPIINTSSNPIISVICGPVSFYFYLARCRDDSLYAGYCRDPEKREQAHNDSKGAKYTRAHLPIKIIYTEKFATRSEAMKREAEIKKLTRAEKEKLVRTL